MNKVIINKMFGAMGNARLIQYQVEEITDENKNRYFRCFVYYKGSVFKGEPTMNLEEAEFEAMEIVHELLTPKVAI